MRAAASDRASRGSATWAKATAAVEIGRRVSAGHHGRGAARHGIRDEARAIGLRTGQRDEDLARRNLAAVEGDAGDRARRVGGEGPGKEVAEAEAASCHVLAVVTGCWSASSARAPGAEPRHQREGLRPAARSAASRPRIGAVRSITLPVVTPAFQAAVE